MACKKCEKECNWNVIMPCRVCELNNNDSRPKKVCWCKLCEAYICKNHIDAYISRGIAALKNLVSRRKEKAKLSKEIINPDPVQTPEEEPKHKGFIDKIKDFLE